MSFSEFPTNHLISVARKEISIRKLHRITQKGLPDGNCGSDWKFALHLKRFPVLPSVNELTRSLGASRKLKWKKRPNWRNFTKQNARFLARFAMLDVRSSSSCCKEFACTPVSHYVGLLARPKWSAREKTRVKKFNEQYISWTYCCAHERHKSEAVCRSSAFRGIFQYEVLL